MANKSKMLPRSAFDCPHVKSVKVWALVLPSPKPTKDGYFQNAGRIVANYSDNPNGAVCTVTLHFFAGPLAIFPSTTGTAGGGGYDKFSAAVADALDRAYGLDKDTTQYHDESGNDFRYFVEQERPMWEALQARKLDAEPTKAGGWRDMHGAGSSAVRAFLEFHGYSVLEVI